MTVASFTSLLKEGRARRGLDDVTAASMLGLSIYEYNDLEAYEDEWRTVVAARVVANAVNFFEVDWRSCALWPTGKSVDTAQPIDTFCRALRRTQGLTREEFADRVGLYLEFCDVIEGHRDGLSLWPVDVAVELARTFEVDSLGLVENLLKPPMAAAPFPSSKRE